VIAERRKRGEKKRRGGGAGYHAFEKEDALLRYPVSARGGKGVDRWKRERKGRKEEKRRREEGG